MTDPAQVARPRGGPLRWVLAFLLASGAGFGLLIGIGCAIGANACPFAESGRITSTDGATIFTQGCAACHGLDGQGGQGGPTLVEGPVAELSHEELVAKIARGRPFRGMPRFKNELSDEQMDAVAAYVASLGEESR